MDLPGPPDGPIQFYEFQSALDKFQIANDVLLKAIEMSAVFIKIKPRPHLSFLNQFKLCNGDIYEEINRYYQNDEIMNENLLNETLEFNYTIIVIWERVLCRIFRRIDGVPRFADVSTPLENVINTIKNLHEVVESPEVQGMRILRYPEIELDETERNLENQKRGAYHERERIHDQSSQTFKLLEYVRNLKTRERLYAMNEIMKEKFNDERLYYDLCMPYGEFVKRYEAIHKLKMPPNQVLTRIGPRTPSPAAVRNESIERSEKSSEFGPEVDPIEVDRVDSGEKESKVDDVMDVDDVGGGQRGETPEDVREPEAMSQPRESSPDDVSEPEGAREVSPEDADVESDQEEPMSPRDAPEDAGIPEIVERRDVSREASEVIEDPEDPEGSPNDDADVESILDPTSPYNQREDLPPESPVFAPEIPRERPTYSANNGSPNSSHHSEADEDRRRRPDTPEEDILMESFDEENAEIEEQNENDSEDSDEDNMAAPELVGLVPRNPEDREPLTAPCASPESAPEVDEEDVVFVNQRERSATPPPDTFDETLALESPEGRRLSEGSGCSEDSGGTKTPEVKKEPEDQMPSPDIFEASFVQDPDVPGPSDRVVEAPEFRRPEVKVEDEEEAPESASRTPSPESDISEDNAVVEAPESRRPPRESSEKPVEEAAEVSRTPSPESNISDDNAVVEAPESRRFRGRPSSERSEEAVDAPGASEDMRSASSRSNSPDDDVVMEDSESRRHLSDSEGDDAPESMDDVDMEAPESRRLLGHPQDEEDSAESDDDSEMPSEDVVGAPDAPEAPEALEAIRIPSPGSNISDDNGVAEAPESRRLLGRQPGDADSAESDIDEEDSTEDSNDSDDDNAVVETPESGRLLERPPSESLEEAVMPPEAMRSPSAGSDNSDDNGVAEAPESRRRLERQPGDADSEELDNDNEKSSSSNDNLKDSDADEAPETDMALLREFFENIPGGDDDDHGTPSSYHSSEISSNPTTPERHQAPPAIEVDGAVYRPPDRDDDVADSEGIGRRDGGADAGTSSGVHGFSDNEEFVKVQKNQPPNGKKRTKRGIRYNEEFKVSVVKYARDKDIVEATKKFGVSKPSVLRWMEQIELSEVEEEGPERNVGSLRWIFFVVEMELWINKQKEKNLRPTREEVLKKAEEVDSTMLENTDWVHSLLKEHDLLPQIKSEPEEVSIPKMIDHILSLETTRIENRYRAILACDEVYLDFDWSRTESDEAKQVSMTLTGHEILNVAVMLCARSDGSKCRPYVLLPVRTPDGSITHEFQKFMKLVWAGTAEFDEILAQDFLKKIVGNSVSTGQLLIWDDDETHISDGTKDTLNRLNIDAVVIPEGIETLLQASTCFWEAPFKAKVQEFYEEWMIHGQKTFTRTRKMKPPPMNLYLKWILDAWRELPKDLIIRSFKGCGLSTIPGGVEDESLFCFREFPQGLEMLKKARAPPEESEDEGVVKQEEPDGLADVVVKQEPEDSQD